ncbi:uncharacterized protein LOC134817568 [Bolinopsis microptera]|uniref:uncharacterized protein LOC134817568 n=1 Tax=Bolinopsis microptera TaxID=2820187 RepID=UPI00307A5778
MKFLCVALFVLLACGAMGAKSKSPKQQFVKAHKTKRKLHGTRKLGWDADIATVAQKWCDYLRDNNLLEHSQGSGYGENLYKSWGTSSDGAATRAVDSWYNEISDYDYAKPGFSMTTGHFTQVVWESSKKVGCGISTKDSETWVCCNYEPPGNYGGQYANNVLPLKTVA